MATPLLAATKLVPFLLLAFLAAALAALVHRRARSRWSTIAIASLAAPVVWFALTLPWVLADGWLGLHQELPHMLRAFALCLLVTCPAACAATLTLPRPPQSPARADS